LWGGFNHSFGGGFTTPFRGGLFPTGWGGRLLHKAVAQGRRALTFALAQRFASLNKIDQKDAEERTALHLAAEKNQHLMVSDLISLGANVNEQDSSGKTPLHLCAENGYLRVLEVLKNCKNNGVCVQVDVPDHCGFTPLHCAALAHTVLVTESQGTAGHSSTGRLLRLRKEQILEGILCLLQMGAEPQLQVLNSCQTSSTACLGLEENTELMCLLQTHKPQAQDVLQESCSLLDAPRGIPAPPAAENLPELCSLASSELLDGNAENSPHLTLVGHQLQENNQNYQKQDLRARRGVWGEEQKIPTARAPKSRINTQQEPTQQLPRDSLCTCPPGFGSSGRDGRSCVRSSYPECGGSAARSPEGQCLSSAGWARYCSHKGKDF
ncbi:NF-kappa-B inhibitor zeta, partial [Lamprotornis superbus]